MANKTINLDEKIPFDDERSPDIPKRAEELFNSECAHPVRVVVNRGGEITIVTAEGTKIEQGEAPSYGVTIDVHFQTEDGQIFAERLKFHKGNMYRWQSRREKIKRRDELQIIWRN